MNLKYSLVNLSKNDLFHFTQIKNKNLNLTRDMYQFPGRCYIVVSMRNLNINMYSQVTSRVQYLQQFKY